MNAYIYTQFGMLIHLVRSHSEEIRRIFELALDSYDNLKKALEDKSSSAFLTNYIFERFLQKGSRQLVNYLVK